MKRVVVGVSLLLLLSGCQTTGDPNAGGLFGWSEKKAKTRQTEYKSTLSSVEADYANVDQHLADVSALTTDVQKEIGRNDRILGLLIAENVRLEQDVAKLLKAKDDLDEQIRHKLAETRAAEAQLVNLEARVLLDESTRDDYYESIKQTNEQYSQIIVELLKD